MPMYSHTRAHSQAPPSWDFHETLTQLLLNILDAFANNLLQLATTESSLRPSATSGTVRYKSPAHLPVISVGSVATQLKHDWITINGK